MNLNEMLEMLENQVVSGIEKKASEQEVEKKETPALAEQFTKSAAARKEAEELGVKVALDLLKEAEEKCEAEEKKEEKKEKKDEEKSESKEVPPQFLKKEEDMDKKASLVDIITGMLEKSAFEGDENTQNGIANAVPNKAQVDSAAMVADQDAMIAPTPGTDGENQGGTVNQILDAIVAKAQAEGAISPNQAAPGSMAGAERTDDEVEKTAAVVALVEAGVDFDSAVDLVKQAEVELEEEAFEVEKQAAFASLIEAGVDFDSAISLVKEASAAAAGKKLAGKIAKKVKNGIDVSSRAVKNAPGEAAEGFGNAVYNLGNRLKGEWGDLKTQGRILTQGKVNKGDLERIHMADGGVGFAAYGKGSTGANRSDKIKALNALGRNRIAQGVAGLGVAGAAGGAYAAHQKKAAFDQLVADGFDFETAVELVKQASEELGM